MEKDREYYLNLGYEDHGYVSPELSDSDEYPDYIKEEVNESVMSVRRHRSADTFSFGFMTDLHYAASDKNAIRMKRNINAYREICSRTDVNFLALGGDYTNEGVKEYKMNCFRELRAFFSGIDYYPVNGNHDDGSIWEKSYIFTEGEEHIISHAELFTLFYNHLPEKDIKMSENTLYYFFDDPINKVRFIFLDVNEAPCTKDEDGHLKYRAQWFYDMSEAQLDWLANVALRFNEDGWSVILFAHSILQHYDTTEIGKGGIRENLRPLHNLLSSYKKGENCNIDFGKNELRRRVKAVFANMQRGSIIAFFAGDYHRDYVEITDGIPYIITANSVMYYSEASPAGKNKIKRIDGDKSELLFDIVTVDKKNKKIYLTRVGAGEDRIVDFD